MSPIETAPVSEPDVQAERIGARIRQLRHARGMTLVQLADKAALSHPFLSQLERGRARPSISSLESEVDGKGYGDLKGATAEAVVAAFDPIRTRTRELLDDPAELDRVLAGNAERAEAIADATLSRVYDAIGFLRRA